MCLAGVKFDLAICAGQISPLKLKRSFGCDRFSRTWGWCMQELLLHVFHTIEQANIRYCVLRGYEELEEIEDGGDVDLLVQADQLDHFREVLARLDFVLLPVWGHAPHRFFVAYDQSADRWLKLDVLTTVAFGKPIHAIYTNLANTCLDRRRRREPTFVLSAEDELLTLLLHCALDKGVFAPHRRARIQALRHEVNDTRYLAEQLHACWSPEMSWQRLAELIDGERWADLLAERTAVAAWLARGQQLGVLGRRIGRRLLRKLDRVAGALQPRSLMVALLAPDGGGKTTLATELVRRFFLPSRYIYMGTNIEASTVGLPTTRWFQARSKRPKQAGQMPAWALARGLRFVNNMVEQWYRYGISYYHSMRGRLILFDRYIYDRQLDATRKRSLKTRARRWLLAAAAPKPDLVVFLDAPGELLYARKGEHSPEILEQQRQHYLGLREHIPQMVVVDATRDADQVRQTVTALIWRSYAKHLRGGLAARGDRSEIAHERTSTP
jgi:thymidylate kinase